MAYERLSDKTTYGDSLDSFVSNIDAVLTKQIAVRNAEDEAKFSGLVLNDNISLESQLDYRQEQLKRVSDSPDEKKRIKAEITTLKDRIEQKTFGDAYLQKLSDFESGISSVDSVIDWLNETKANTTDQTILDTIQKQLVEKQSQRYELVKGTIKNQTDYAINDTSGSLLETQIEKVTNERNKALFGGDSMLVSIYDLQLQSLSKAKAENDVQNAMTGFAVGSITGYSTATKLLDNYNTQIQNAASSGPITIGGNTYQSAREFWTYKRDSYLADSSASGFFSQYSTEVKNKITTANSKNSLDTSGVRDITSGYDQLTSRPELAAYSEKIGQYKQDSIQTGTDLVASTILNRYAVDYDLNKAVADIGSLKAVGGNVGDALTKVITTGGQIKSGQVNNILAAAQNALANDPNLTPEQALLAAISAGAGAVLSPEQLANKSETDIAKDFSKGAADSSFSNDPRTTADPATTPNVPSVTKPATAAPAATPNATLNTYEYVDRNGALKTIQATSSAEAMSKAADRASNSGVSLKTSSAAPTATPAQPSKAATPTPAPTPAPVPVATPTPAKSVGASYAGSSVVDFLTLAKQDASYTNRANLAKANGIQNYSGSAEQNTQLLNILKTKY